ncbi:MAG: site-2 protease family protein [Pseudomonadota bacterium]
MSWSVKILQLGDTALRLHLTFFLLLIWIAVSYYPQGGIAAAAEGVLFVVLVFVCVVLHELGHVVAAQRYGIRTPEITVLPIGGLARLERMPEKPVQELVVAIAGPLVNVVIAAALILLLEVRVDPASVTAPQAAGHSLQAQLAFVNIILVVFNLIPAFPLDGGRIFRALLGFFMRRDRATTVAARVGQATAVLFALVGLFYNPFLVLIAVFMFFAAEAESSHETMRADTSGHVARDAMIARFESLGPAATAEEAGRLLILTTQQEFPVIGADGRLGGMVTRKKLIEAMGAGGPATPVRDFMETGVPEVAAEAPLERVMEAIYAHPARAAAVVDTAGRLAGYVSAENASELFMLERARRRAR